MRVHFSVLQRQDFESEGTREARRHERGGLKRFCSMTLLLANELLHLLPWWE